MNIIKRIPAIIILCVSWYLSSQPVIPHMPSFWNADKLVHLFCFAGFAGSWTFWFKCKTWTERFRFCFLICVLIVSFYGIIDEFHQSFTPGRDTSVFDWMADTLGAMLGAAAGGMIMRFISKKLSGQTL